MDEGEGSNGDPVQTPDERSPLAIAMSMTSRVTTISLMTAMPGIAGAWIDSRWGTSLFLPLGIVLGFIFGTFQLVQLAKEAEDDSKPSG